MSSQHYCAGDPPRAIAARRVDLGAHPGADRTVLVGELNPYGGAPDFALYPEPPHSAGGRLPAILGISEDEQLATWRANLCYGAWDNEDAARTMRRLLEEEVPWSRLVLLGSRPRRAFETLGLDTTLAGSGLECEHRRVVLHGMRPFSVVMMPHPSGRCRLWNVPGVKKAAAAMYAGTRP